MKLSSLIQMTSKLLVALFATASLHADVVSLVLTPLPDHEVNGTPEPRVDVLAVDLDPQGADLVGQPGETVGWSFKINWSSNAGDSLVFNGSTLEPAIEWEQAGVYVDLIGDVGGNQDGSVPANSEWATPEPFIAGTHGIGAFTISGDAVPGTIYRGTLRLGFKVYRVSGETQVLMNNFSLPLEVSLTIGAVDLTEQTITFPEISGKLVNDASFALGAEADSGLPVFYISLNPDLCSVEDGMATIHGAGEVAIVAIQEGDGIHAAAEPVTHNFEISKVPATIGIQGDMEQDYTGGYKLFTAVTEPAGLAVRWLYNGEETPPREPGIYVIHALVNDAVHDGTAQARLVITDNTPAPLIAYSDWLLANFTAQEIQDGLVTVKEAAPSGDGATNLLKYAFGLDPNTAMPAEARAALPRFDNSGGANALVFKLPVVAARDLIIKIEASANLTDWTEIARRTRGGPWTGSAFVFTGTPDETGTRAQTLVAEPPAPEDTQRFYRMNLEFSP
jgi:hypothetical protein